MAKHRKRSRPTYVPKPQYRINDAIRVPEVRLVGDNLTPGIYPTRKALSIARSKQLDLVEIAPTAKPPVCRVIDYSKFLYEKKRKEKEIKQKTVKTIVKEIRFTPNTDDHDVEFKAKHAERFLLEGAKVKAYVQFRGRAILFKERGELLLLKFVQRLEEVGILEQMPRLEGKRMFIFLAPKKRNKPKVEKAMKSGSTKGPSPKNALKQNDEDFEGVEELHKTQSKDTGFDKQEGAESQDVEDTENEEFLEPEEPKPLSKAQIARALRAKRKQEKKQAEAKRQEATAKRQEVTAKRQEETAKRQEVTAEKQEATAEKPTESNDQQDNNNTEK